MHTRAMRTATSVRRPVRGCSRSASSARWRCPAAPATPTSRRPAPAPGSGSESASAKPYLPVPDGVELTPPGSRLALGEPATVAYEPRQDQVGVLTITVTRLEKTTFKQSFAGWKLDAATRRTNPYFVRAKVENVGDTDLGGRNVPLYIVDGRNTLIEASSFASTFKPCPVGQFPKKFGHGDRADVCLVYLSPQHGDLTAASFRPTQEFSPITWTGKLTRPEAATSAKDAKKDRRAKATKQAPRRASRAERSGRRAAPDLGAARRAPDNGAMSRSSVRHPNAAPAPGGTGLSLGSLQVRTPVVLAPMAGITNAAYRRLCLEQTRGQGGDGVFVCEMITSPRAGRGRRAHPGHAGLRRARDHPLGAALRHRPGLRRQGRRDPLRGVRRRAHRPQLRLPGPQGHPQGRWGSAAVEARPARRDPHRGGRRRHAVRRAGHDEDPQGARRRPPHLPRRRTDRAGDRRRGDRAARADRGAVLLRRRRLGGDRRAWSSTSTSRCSATATSGRPPTRCGWSSRPAPPASWSAAAAWAGRGSSATSPRRSPASDVATLPTLGEVRDDDAPPRRAALPAHGGGARLQGVPQARLVVPQGLRRRRRRCAARWPWSPPWPSSTCCSTSWTRPSRSRSRSSARLAGRQGSPRARVVLPEGWLDDTDGSGARLREDAGGDHRRLSAVPGS